MAGLAALACCELAEGAGAEGASRGWRGGGEADGDSTAGDMAVGVAAPGDTPLVGDMPPGDARGDDRRRDPRSPMLPRRACRGGGCGCGCGCGGRCDSARVEWCRARLRPSDRPAVSDSSVSSAVSVGRRARTDMCLVSLMSSDSEPSSFWRGSDSAESADSCFWGSVLDWKKARETASSTRAAGTK